MLQQKLFIFAMTKRERDESSGVSWGVRTPTTTILPALCTDTVAAPATNILGLLNAPTSSPQILVASNNPSAGTQVTMAAVPPNTGTTALVLSQAPSGGSISWVDPTAVQFTGTTNGAVYIEATGTPAVQSLASTAAGTTGQLLTATTGAAPGWSALSATTATSLTGALSGNGSTLTGGTLSVANGGTGNVTTGVLKPTSATTQTIYASGPNGLLNSMITTGNMLKATTAGNWRMEGGLINSVVAPGTELATPGVIVCYAPVAVYPGSLVGQTDNNALLAEQCFILPMVALGFIPATTANGAGNRFVTAQLRGFQNLTNISVLAVITAVGGLTTIADAACTGVNSMILVKAVVEAGNTVIFSFMSVDPGANAYAAPFDLHLRLLCCVNNGQS